MQYASEPALIRSRLGESEISRHLSACWLLTAAMTLGAVVSILAGWPAQFPGATDPDWVWVSFLFFTGTALSPSLTAIVFFAVSTLVAHRSDGWGIAGIVVSILMTLDFIVLSVGTAFGAAVDAPQVVVTMGGLLGLCLSGLAMITGLAALRARLSSRTPPESG